jgi:putative transposase
LRDRRWAAVTSQNCCKCVRRTVPSSAEIQTKIDELLSSKLVEDPKKMLSELARLGARLIIQRAVEEEFEGWLGRARYERRPGRQRGLRNYGDGYRNGYRPRRVQTAEGELRIEIPQAREAAEPFVSKLFRKGHTKRPLRTDPLKAMVVGAFVRGLSVRDVESLCEEAGLGRTSKSTVARICSELHERFAQFCRRDLYEVKQSRGLCAGSRGAAALLPEGSLMPRGRRSVRVSMIEEEGRGGRTRTVAGGRLRGRRG